MNLKFTTEAVARLVDTPGLAIRYPEFELRYDEEANDRLIQVNAGLKAAGNWSDWSDK